MTRTPVRPLWLALALTGLAPVAWADGALLEVQETIVTSAHQDPFAAPRYRHRDGIGLGVGHRGPGLGVGVGVGFGGRYQVDRFALERALDDEVRARRASLSAQAERRGGFLLAFQEGARDLDDFGWRVRAAVAVRAWLVLPEREARAVGRPAASGLRLALSLRGERGTALVPVALEEVRRLDRDAKGDRETVLGALLRGAWAEAGGKKSTRRRVKIVVADPSGRLLGQVAGPSLDSVTGRRGLFGRLWAKLTRKRDADLPALDAAHAGGLASDLARAELLADSGLTAELTRQVARRHGPLGADRVGAGLVESLGR